MIVTSTILYRSWKAVAKKAIVLSRTLRQNGYSVLHLLNRELTTRPDLPLARRLWAYRHGYVSASIPLYGLDEDNRHEYLSQWESERARQINGDTALIHEDKLLFYYVLWPKFSHVLPTLYEYVVNDRFLDTPFSSDSYDGLLDCVDRMGKVVVKPVGGSLGTNVHVLEQSDGAYYVDGKPKNAGWIDRLGRVSDGHIVTEFVKQAPYAARIFPDTSNTLRIMTMVEPDTHEPFIGALDHRFGTSESIPVDNTARGGLSAGVDLSTGRLETAVFPPKDETLERFDAHPETHAPITGVEIPGWSRICEGLLEMAAYLAPITPYIGWDVLVTDEDGSFVVVEANSYPDVPLQTHEPLLADERVRRFYEYHGVV